MHGGTGDDVIYLGGGDDIAFGDADHDDIIGGWGNDWISGGTGVDGVIGDDGRIFTSRNEGLSDDGSVSLKGNTRSFGNYGTEFAESLYGVFSLLNADPDSRTSQGVVLNEEIYTPGQVQRALINRAGRADEIGRSQPVRTRSRMRPLCRSPRPIRPPTIRIRR